MKKFLSLGASLAIAPVIYQSSAAAISLDFAVPSDVQVGQSIDVGIVISELGDASAPSLGGFDFDVNFDSSILSFDSVAFGDPVLGNQLELDPFGFGVLDIVDDSAAATGTVNLFELSGDSDTILDASQPDTFTLAVLTFDAIAAGTSNLDFSVNELSDALGDPLNLSNININNISVEVETGVVTSVPESPATFGLLVLGLLGLGSRLCKKEK